jgi:tetratricopeptide (TPR) repeat protein
MKYAALFAILVTLAPLAASAEPVVSVPERARQLAALGRARHEAGDYNSAVRAFEEAYVLAPSPELLFDLAQAFRLAGNCDAAAMTYRRYLATAPDPQWRDFVERRLASLARCTARADARTLGPPERLPVAMQTELSVTPAMQPMVPAGEQAGRRAIQLGLGLMVAGGVALAGAAYFALDADSASNSVSAGYQRGAAWSQLAADDARGKSSAEAATALGLVGGVAIAGGAASYLLGRRAAHARIELAPSLDGARVRAAWTF